MVLFPVSDKFISIETESPSFFFNVKFLSLPHPIWFFSSFVLLASKFKITQHLIEPAIFSLKISFIYLLYLRHVAVCYICCYLHLDPFQSENDVSNGLGSSIRA